MFKKIVTAAMLTTLGLGLAFGVPGTSLPAHAASTATVELNDIVVPLVPTRVLQGDREFGGNGPDIVAKVDLQVSSDRRKIEAKVFFRARETKSDWSTTEATWTRTVFTAPAGKTIDRVLGDTSSEVRFRSVSAGFQILGPGEDFKTFIATLERLVNQILDAERTLSNRSQDTQEVQRAREILSRVNSGVAGLQFEGNHVHTVHPPDGPVNLFAIVGDTGGDDISKDDNPKDDTRIQAIAFNRVQVQYR